MFCAVKLDIPLPRVVKDSTAKLLYFIAAEYPAITASPKVLIMLCMTMLPTDTKPCCNILGMATLANSPSISLENTRCFSSERSFFSLKTSTAFATTQLMPWQMNVAHATPATPMENTVTKSMSTNMLATDETASRMNGVTESPRAAKTPVAML